MAQVLLSNCRIIEERDLRIYYLACLLIIVLSFCPGAVFAQQMPLALRDNAIMSAFQLLQVNRDKAMTSSFQEAQMRLLDGKFKEAVIIKNKPTPSFLSNFRLRNHPYASLESVLDDNVDLSGDHKKTAFSNKVILGLKNNITSKYLTTILDLKLDTTYYKNRTRSNTQGAEVKLQNYFNLGRYAFSISDTYNNNYIVSDNFVDSDLFEHYWSNTFNTTLSRDYNRLGYSLGYSYIQTEYENDFSLGNDHTDHTFTFKQYLKVATKTRFMFDYEHGITEYIHQQPGASKDFHYDDFSLGVTGVLSAKMTALLNTAYRFSDYKEDDDYNKITATGKISYVMSPNTNMALTYQHIAHDPGDHTDNFRENIITISGDRRLSFNRRFKFTYDASYDRAVYPKGDIRTKRNTRYSWGLGLIYNFREWVDLSLEYDNKQYRSNVDTSYKNNILKFKTSAKF